MSAQTLTSVIMVTYHTGPVLEAAIKAILAQTANVELILVNNGNPPEVEEKLIEQFKEDPCVRVMTGHGNVGLSKAVNLGARVARGEHLFLLNPRCCIQPDVVARLVEQGQAIKEPYVLGCRLMDSRGKETKSSRRAILTPQTVLIESLGLYRFYPKLRLRFHEEPVPEKVSPVPAISSSCMFLSRKSFFDMKGFIELFETHIAGMDFCHRFLCSGGTVYFVPDIEIVLADKQTKVDRIQLEKDRARNLVCYFHENFSDRFFQPLLWSLYAFIWLRAGIRMFI
ncbi:MAG: glycosyltransferase family 2 protein [Bdellovibrionales bacterium]